MSRLILALAAGMAFAGPALAQAGEAEQPRGLAAIPAEYHGRWTDRPAECARPTDLNSNLITIDARSWLAYEEGGHVTGVGAVRSGTRYFRVRNSFGAEEADGILALRRAGDILYISFNQMRDGQPTHYAMRRCPG